MMLDRGEELGWFGSTEIIVEAILAIVGFYFFLADCFTSQRPFISLRIFRDWNFAIALVFMFLIGIILLATMALVTPFIQNMLGYPVLSSGYLLGRAASALSSRCSSSGGSAARSTRASSSSSASCWRPRRCGRWSAGRSTCRGQTIAINSVMQGFGLGFVFVPLNTIAFASLPGELRTEGAALWTLIRNIGSSVGISIVIAQLTSMIASITASSSSTSRRSATRCTCRTPAMLSGMGLPNLEALEAMVTQQAAAMAYSNDFC